MAGVHPSVFRFDGFELDTARFELRSGGTPVHVEPQVLSLLILLAENDARMVGKDELIDKIWDGRIVSESAVAARIKAAPRPVPRASRSTQTRPILPVLPLSNRRAVPTGVSFR